ncbi:DUF485 domain-containing protein [Streptomyces cadmiisoli]|uniref:DUF485 domain-containing protein n=1 Tax=Streptomyces cadmiisoli TaxID=2184053 RepID=UPI0036585DD0
MHSSNGRARGGGSDPEDSFENREDRHPGVAAASGTVKYDDPWYDALASGWGESGGSAAASSFVPTPRPEVPDPAKSPAAAEVYLEVQRSAAFQEVRGRYLRFVVPAGVGFFAWYVAYVVTATTAPGFMARPVVGAVNVAMLAGLGQFLSTFLLTWAYARHARLRRDRAALELRWDTQELTRGARGGAL